MEECCGINLEQEMTIENLYCFIRASLQCLATENADGTFRKLGPVRVFVSLLTVIKFLIILICVHVSFANRS